MLNTAKTRINISLSNILKDALVNLAHRDRVPPATKAARLLETALELEEDRVWDMVAQKRDSKAARYISHDKAWK